MHAGTLHEMFERVRTNDPLLRVAAEQQLTYWQPRHVAGPVQQATNHTLIQVNVSLLITHCRTPFATLTTRRRPPVGAHTTMSAPWPNSACAPGGARDRDSCLRCGPFFLVEARIKQDRSPKYPSEASPSPRCRRQNHQNSARASHRSSSRHTSAFATSSRSRPAARAATAHANSNAGR